MNCVPGTWRCPTQEAGEIRLRVVAKPDKPLAQPLLRLGIELPNVSRTAAIEVPNVT